MVDNVVLDAIKVFLLEHVSPKIKLQIPSDDDIGQYKLMHPNAFVGWLPPPNVLDDAQFIVDGIKQAVPCMIVGMDEGEDDSEDSGINIRITFITHNLGLYIPTDEDPNINRIVVNFQGYKDLLNLIFICRQQLSSKYLISKGQTAAVKPFRWGMYPNQPIPYWVGWLTFRAQMASLPFIDLDQYLE